MLTAAYKYLSTNHISKSTGAMCDWKSVLLLSGSTLTGNMPHSVQRRKQVRPHTESAKTFHDHIKLSSSTYLRGHIPFEQMVGDVYTYLSTFPPPNQAETYRTKRAPGLLNTYSNSAYWLPLDYASAAIHRPSLLLCCS